MDTEKIKAEITNNAAEIVRLHNLVHEEIQRLDGSNESNDRWRQRCAEFHTRYDALAFPGGYAGALQRILSGDPETMETALCFLELRPYFFRSGYMFKDILRKCKRAPLSESQAARLAVVIQKRTDWQATHPRPFPERYSIKTSLANRARFKK